MRNFTNIALLVKQARQNHPKQFSQNELSNMLGYKNGQFISNIERGLCSIPGKSLNKLISILDMDPEILKEALLKDMEATLDGYLAQPLAQSELEA